MNEIFTEESRQAINCSQDEATRLHHDFIGTEHLLLGLLAAGESEVTALLENAGVDLSDLKCKIEEVAPPASRDSSAVGQKPLTSRAKRVLEMSGIEARALKSKDIKPEHILLALVKEVDGVAAQVLATYDLEYKEVWEWLDAPSGTGPNTAESRGWIKLPMSEVVSTVLANAHADAARRANNEIVISHILLALIKMEDDPATRILIEAGVNLPTLKDRLDTTITLYEKSRFRIDLERKQFAIRHLSGTSANVPFSKQAKQIFIYACFEAMTRNLETVDTICLLLAMLNNTRQIPAILLAQYGINYYSVERQLSQTT